MTGYDTTMSAPQRSFHHPLRVLRSSFLASNSVALAGLARVRSVPVTGT